MVPFELLRHFLTHFHPKEYILLYLHPTPRMYYLNSRTSLKEITQTIWNALLYMTFYKGKNPYKVDLGQQIKIK